MNRVMLMIALSSMLAMPAAAAPIVLRMSTVAPDGSAWSHEMRSFARDVASQTANRIRIKWYWSGITGDDQQTEERINRGQLDGAAAAMMCEQICPSMAAFRVQGLLQSRAEQAYVLQRLRATLDAEAAKSGFVLLGLSAIGPDVAFTRVPVHSMAELRQLRMWRWDLDPVGVAMSRAMGMKVVTLPVDQAAHAFDNNQIDGFFAVPTAALAFQWSTRARYLLDLQMGQLPGCVVMAERSFARLPIDAQQVLRAASAKFSARFDDVGREQDQALLGGLFGRQGVRPVTASDSFRADFFAAARAARDRLDPHMVSPSMLERVLAILADYRSEHPVQHPKNP